MGDISDFYINNMLNRHMNPEKELLKAHLEEKEKRDNILYNMKDDELIDLSANSLIDGDFNFKFEKTSRYVIRDYYNHGMKLADSQRRALYGLLMYKNF